MLRRLVADKRVLAISEPLSTRAGRPALYRISDSNLRLYLAIGRAAQDLIRRGRQDAAFRLIQRRWTTWRGRAVEPLIRESLELGSAAGMTPWPAAEAVGGWWNRQFDPEIDIVGADRTGVAGQIFFVGAIKWLESPFDRHDVAHLAHSAAAVPGYVPGDTGLAVVSLSGRARSLEAGAVQLEWGPAEVLAAWQV